MAAAAAAAGVEPERLEAVDAVEEDGVHPDHGAVCHGKHGGAVPVAAAAKGSRPVAAEHGPPLDEAALGVAAPWAGLPLPEVVAARQPS
jgi:hypothetical protein